MDDSPDEQRSFSRDRLDSMLEKLAAMAVLPEKAEALPISDAQDELDAIAFAVNVLIGELRFANQAKSAFLRNVSHELRTPVTVLLSAARLLGRDDTPESAELLKEKIDRSGSVLLNLLDNVLDIARIESGHVDQHTERFRLSRILNDLRLIFETKANEKGLRLVCGDALGYPALEGDALRLRQILFNLVGNAVKYTDKGTVRIEYSLERSGDEARLSVSVEDTGVGISLTEQKRLFSPFERGRNTSSVEGTGLGLHLATVLADTIGAELRLSWSEPDRGTRFDLRVPLRVAEQEFDEPERPSKRAPLHGLRILLAEDSSDVRDLYQKMLTIEGARVDAVGDGDAAVSYGLQGDYDVILMDIHMPGRNGLEATRDLRVGGIAAPILALSADVTREIRDECAIAGCDSHLPKPIDFDELIAAIMKTRTQASDPSQN